MDLNSVIFIGGDKRQLAAAQALADFEKLVNIWGFDEAKKDKINVLNDTELDSAIEKSDAVILPLPVTKDGKNIFSSKELSLSKVIEKTGKNKAVFAGMIDERTKRAFEKNGCTVYDYFRREDVAVRNAFLTAQGILSLILSNIDIAVNELKVCITGYGKTAKAAAYFLFSLGADVCIYARNSAQRAQAENYNLKSKPIKTLDCDAKKYNLFINTVPALIFSREIIGDMNNEAMIIDIASAPFGTNFLAAKEKGIKAIQAGSLPGKAAPVTAGRIIAKAIIEMAGGELNEQ